jgi:hypothetical protein
MADSFAEDITGRCRWALAHNDGTPSPAWSTGERLYVALVLRDRQYLGAEGYTVAQVVSRLAGDLGVTFADECADWVQGIRVALEGDEAWYI